jgi:hypothetical protein
MLRNPDGTAEDLNTELALLITEEQRANGAYRVNHTAGNHDDRYTALALAALLAVQLPDKRSPSVFVFNGPQPPDPPDRHPGDHTGVRFIPSFDSWQAVLEREGEAIDLGDYPTKDDAALAVNLAHQLLGIRPPNTIDPDKHPPAEVRDRHQDLVARKLRDRRLIA